MIKLKLIIATGLYLQATFQSFASAEDRAPVRSPPIPAPDPTPLLDLGPSVCNVDDIYGSAYLFVAYGMCIRVELREEGRVEGDSSDTTCSNAVFNPDIIFSTTDDTNTADNTYIFRDGPDANTAYSGTFQFLEDDTIITPELVTIDFDHETRKYAFQLTVPSCSYVCPIRSVGFKTYYFKALGVCWKVGIFSGGELERSKVSPHNGPCSATEFVAGGGIISTFRSISEEDNRYDFDPSPKAENGYSGIFEFLFSPFAVDTRVQINEFDPDNQFYDVTLILPTTCPPVNCDMDDLDSGPYFFFIPGIPDSCFAVQFGLANVHTITIDDSNPGCTNDVFVMRTVFSNFIKYETVDTAFGIVHAKYFCSGDQGATDSTSTIDYLQDTTIIGCFGYQALAFLGDSTNTIDYPQGKLVEFDDETDTLFMEVTLPRCEFAQEYVPRVLTY